jgi:hypothetical protein
MKKNSNYCDRIKTFSCKGKEEESLVNKEPAESTESSSEEECQQ